MKKRWSALILLALIALSALAVRYVSGIRARKKREASYQVTLSSYSAVLKPGMNRKDVEAYLRAKNIQFRQMCCVDTKAFSQGVYDDLAKIGQEDAPWFCNEHNIYVAFQFAGPPRSSIAQQTSDSDILKAITIFSWFEGCL